MMAGPPSLTPPSEKAHVLALLVEQFQKVNAVFGRRCYLLHHCVLVPGEWGTVAPRLLGHPFFYTTSWASTPLAMAP